MSDLFYYEISSNKDSMYRTINLFCFKDSNLSWKAKGILCYLMTRPPDWKLWHKDLINKSSTGESSIRAGINELIVSKYIHRGKIYQDGKIKCFIHVVFSEPTDLISLETKKRLENLFVGNLKVGNLKVGNLKVGNLKVGNLKVENQVYRKNINDRKNMNDNISKDIYNVSGETYKKNSLKKQMGLEDNSSKQIISNKKKRNKLPQEDEDKIRNCKFTMKIINLWNSFAPATPQHKSPSFIWKSIHLSLRQLRKGTFYQRHNWTGSYFDQFCQINKITPQQIKNVLDRSFRKKEIISGIKLLVSYCKEGNFIKRQGYSKTLSLMFYNEESPFISIFALALIKGEAKPVSELMEVKCKYPRLAEKFKKMEDRRMHIDYDKMSVVDKKQFNKVFSGIEERLSSIPKEQSYYNPGLEGFVRTYYDQLQYLEKIELITFSPWSWQWRKVCGTDNGPFNQIKEWLLGEKDIRDLERKKEDQRNNPISDENYDN